jgi:hypothetical protein
LSLPSAIRLGDLLRLILRARGHALGADELEITGVPNASVCRADLELPRMERRWSS